MYDLEPHKIYHVTQPLVGNNEGNCSYLCSSICCTCCKYHHPEHMVIQVTFVSLLSYLRTAKSTFELPLSSYKTLCPKKHWTVAGKDQGHFGKAMYRKLGLFWQLRFWAHFSKDLGLFLCHFERIRLISTWSIEPVPHPLCRLVPILGVRIPMTGLTCAFVAFYHSRGDGWMGNGD